jgi:hypothetical protein
MKLAHQQHPVRATAKSLEHFRHVVPPLQTSLPATRVREAHFRHHVNEKYFDHVELEAASSEKEGKEGEPTYWGTKAGRKRSTGGIPLVTMMLVRGMPLEEEARLLEARDTKVEF